MDLASAQAIAIENILDQRLVKVPAANLRKYEGDGEDFEVTRFLQRRQISALIRPPVSTAVTTSKYRSPRANSG